MKQKYVTLDVAKVLQEAGYPQSYDEDVNHWYCIDGGLDTNLIDDPICSAPTYIEAWLWICRNKKNIRFEIDFKTKHFATVIVLVDGDVMQIIKKPDVEDAISEAIDCLVQKYKKDLIK